MIKDYFDNQPLAGELAAGQLAESGPPVNPEQDSGVQGGGIFLNTPNVLRVAGAIGVIASILALLLQGWSVDSDINRYYKLLGETSVLTIAGLIMSSVIREYKSARLFFALALCSSIANFTILGALIYSIQPGAELLNAIPEHAQWQIPSDTNVMLLLAVSVILLTMLALFSYSIFSRENNKSLSFGLLLTSALILIPWRGAEASAMVSIVALLIACFTTYWIKNRGTYVKTKEHIFAICTLFVPGIVILARTFYLYDASMLSELVGTGIIYILATLLLNDIEIVESDAHRNIFGKQIAANLLKISQFCAAWLAIGIILSGTESIPEVASVTIATGISLFLLAWIPKYKLQGLLNHTSAGTLNGILAVGNLTLLSLVWISSTSPFSNPIDALFLIAAAAAIHAAGRMTETGATTEKFKALPAVILFGYALYALLWQIVTQVDFGNWMTLAVLGIGFILTASLWEKRELRKHLVLLKQTFSFVESKKSQHH